MKFLGCIGRLTAGSGLEDLLGESYTNNVVHMLSVKAIARVMRGHFILSTALNTSELYNTLLPNISSGCS